MRWSRKKTTSCEKAAFRAIFCYLLCLALVAGYSALKAYRSEIDDYDFAPKLEFSFREPRVEISTNSIRSNWFVANAEGQKLCRIPAIEDLHLFFFSETTTKEELEAIKRVQDHEYYGDMKYTSYSFMGKTYSPLVVPLSKTITTRTIPVPNPDFVPEPEEGMTYKERKEQLMEAEYQHPSPSFCNVDFYGKDVKSNSHIRVSGFSGTLVFHSDNAVELYGDTRDMEVTIDTWKAKWTVSGSGGLYAKVAVVGGEIKAEGLTSYEVE